MNTNSVKKFVLFHSDSCGDLYQIQDGKDYDVSFVYSPAMGTTVGHYHTNADEEYAVIKGQMDLELYDPATQEKSAVTLKDDESFIIKKNIHHKVAKTAPNTQALVISFPAFQEKYEVLSNVLK